MGIKAAFISIGVVMMILSMRFLYISLHFLKSKTSQTLGFLASSEHKRNVYKGGKAGRFYKDWMEYSYNYRVNGKEYEISCSNSGKPANIARVVTVTYQTKRPKYAYIKGLTFPLQPVASAVLFVFAAVFIICGVVA